MNRTITTISRCPGNNHIHIAGTFGGRERVLTITRDDLELEDVGREDLIIARVRSAVKEANATTPNQIRTALEGRSFKV